MIPLKQLEEMFANIRANAPWDLDGELLWGYFFTDPSPDKLKDVADYLASDGYRVVDIYQTDDQDVYFLHVEKIEHHTVQTLHSRNIELEKVAKRFHLKSYDGMNVGPAGTDLGDGQR